MTCKVVNSFCKLKEDKYNYSHQHWPEERNSKVCSLAKHKRGIPENHFKSLVIFEAAASMPEPLQFLNRKIRFQNRKKANNVSHLIPSEINAAQNPPSKPQSLASTYANQQACPQLRWSTLFQLSRYEHKIQLQQTLP